MPDGSPKKFEFSMEMRLLLAFILMGLVLFVTPYFYKPPKRPVPATKQETKTTAPAATQQPPAAVAPSKNAEAPPPSEAAGAQIAAQKEETVVIDTSLYRVEFTNRGAVVKSWVLKQYKDNTGKLVDLVNQAGAAKAGFPFSLVFKNDKPAFDPNQVLWKVARNGLSVDFEYSDGRVLARKAFEFENNRYLTQLRTSVQMNGMSLPHLISWRGGFGDPAVLNPAAAQHSVYYDGAANKLVVSEAKAAKNGPVSTTGAFTFGGIEDVYFAAAFLPVGNRTMEIQTIADTVPGAAKDSKEEPHVGVAVGGDGSNRFALFVGPKDVDLLRRVDPKLEQMVDFGWFAFLARPLFLSLNYVNDRFIHNYGWAIVIVTIIINVLLLPLKITSLKSMKKMSMLQPQIAAINAKYKNLSLRDPRKAEQNQEIMDLYKRHGVNPMGGCMPMVLQIPFFIAFYKVLTVAIEMRGANWLWVHDLSQPETLPIRILPLAMIGTQFWMQKMTPSTTADPAQQRIMLLMPLMLGFMFYGVSSGLVLYWLTGNVFGIVQQAFFNRMAHLPPSAPVVETKPAPKKKK